MEAKARYYLAKYHALSNAATFIESHGEEGFSFSNDKFNTAYLKETARLAEQLHNRAQEFHAKYLDTGITIDDSMTDF